jgi:outer membrane receptor protein involved in Fe transport
MAGGNLRGRPKPRKTHFHSTRNLAVHLFRRPVHAPALLRAVVAIAVAIPSVTYAADDTAPVVKLPPIEVIGTTPLPGLGAPLRDVPNNVQFYTSKDFDRQRQPSLTDFLEQNPTSVSINSAQGNPFQPDISFRGFTASPLLGLPQGLSVFQDGVRINEPFGDIVNWDLVPQSAIATLQLLPGSNPVFGLNTLGGALAIYTKRGRDYPGGDVQVYGGSFGRKAFEFEQGGAHDRWDYYVTGNYFDENGWAEHNPSRVKQLFAKAGYQTDRTDAQLSVTAADNTLQGTQTLPLSFLDNIRQAYTFPDININRLAMVNFTATHALSANVVLGGDAYYRKFRNENVSSNVNDEFGEVDPETGEISDVQAINDRSVIDQRSYGAGLQATLTHDVAGRTNRFVAGISADYGRARFMQESQEAFFTETREAVGVGDFALDTDANTRTRYFGVFFLDTLALSEQWALTVSGRYNSARVEIEDRTGEAPLLNGTHTYRRFNPAVGITFNPNPALTAFGNYSEGMRAPTAIELTCSDPDAPCKLPNNFLADPELKKVVSRTIEAGLRGKWGGSTSWSAAIYRTELSDDIQFISSGAGATNAGFFQNVGRTRRQGLELATTTKLGAWSLSARYSYIDATFQSPFVESSPSNSSADENGSIGVSPGNRIPAIPPHTFKARLDYDGGQWSVGANVLYNSATYARGDENNQDVSGKVPSYAVVNLDARYTIMNGLELFARVNNVFDRRYANFAILGDNVFTGPNRTFDPDNAIKEQFRGLGAPRGGWVGVRYAWH